MELDCKRRQEDERVVLQSIYGDDVTACDNNAWQVWNPLDVIIHLRPVQSASVSSAKAFVSINLHVKCSHSYPSTSSPEIELENAEGISIEDVVQLKALLNNKAHLSKGSEVIMELCQMVQEFLYAHNKPPAPSFHQGMLQQKAALEHERKRLRATSEQRERDEVQAFEEMRKEQLLWKEAENEEDSNISRDVFGSELVSCVDGTERRICGVHLNKNTPRLQQPYSSEWTALEPALNREMLISEWHYEYSLGRNGHREQFNAELFSTKLDWLDTQMKRVNKLNRVHSSLYPYSLLVIHRKALTPTNVNVRVMYGQSMNANDKPLPQTLQSLYSQPELLLPRLATQMCNAVRWLHEANLYHGAVCTANVWMTSKRNYRLSDFFLRHCMQSVSDTFDESMGSVHIETCLDKKTLMQEDVLRIGTLMNTFSVHLSRGSFKDQLASLASACSTAVCVDDILDHPFIDQDGSDMTVPSMPSTSSSQAATKFDANSHSRLNNEFIYIDFLGRGGFGDVVLARNKLDGNEYAVKRILLDPKDERMNKKVTREAKLFSRLNHPNVVRYYSAWIEHVPIVDRTYNNTSDSIQDDSLLPSRLQNAELNAAGTVEGDSTAEWSTSFQPVIDTNSDQDDSTPVTTLFSPSAHTDSHNSDFDVLFEGEAEAESQDEGDRTEESSSPSHTPNTPSPRILFIQMEYCEKSTLRILIDSGKLMGNQRAVWRIAREILQGLLYVHQEGMIHRDIKPMNILIDSNDRIKIGDFGLATRDFFERESAARGVSEAAGSSITRDIGTALYIAPELLSTTTGVSDFTTKIDVYSAGIVLFEMFYRPLLPGMERISTIKALRSAVHFPADFASDVPEAHRKAAKELIGAMLAATPEQRPSVQNILDSERLPIVDIEENQFQKMFSQAVRSRGGRMHQWMLDRMLVEPVPPAADFLYDQAVCAKERLSVSRLRSLEAVREKLSRLCSLHAFIPFTTHSLAPFNDIHTPSLSRPAKTKLNTCRFIDDSGVTVALPSDLRRTFVRYCVRNGLNRLKRYACAKVFSRSEALGGIHPVERSEFSVDSVGACGSASTLTAEILCVVLETANTLQGFHNRKWQLVVGHGSLITAAASYQGFADESAMQKILSVLYSIATSNKVMSREQKVERLRVGGEMSFNQANSLLSILQGDNSTLEGLRATTKPLLRARHSTVSQQVTTAIDDIASTLNILQLLTGERSDHLVVDGSLCYRPQTFSNGVVFQLQVLVSHKHSTRPVVVCTGGRYDELLNQERHVQDPVPPIELCAVGCSFSLDVIAQLMDNQYAEDKTEWCTALVCSTSGSFLKEKAYLVRGLWLRGVSADFLHDPVQCVQLHQLIEHCCDKQIDELLIVFGEDEVLVRSHGSDVGKMSLEEALLRFESHATPDAALCHSPVRHTATPTATASNLNVHYATLDKLSTNTRKRIESQIRVCLHKALNCFAPSTIVHVVVTDLTVDGVRLLAASIERNSSVQDLDASLSSVTAQLNKYKKELKCVRDVLCDLLLPKHNQAVLVLFSKHSSNGYYRFII